MTANLASGELGNRETIENGVYRITRVELYTLRPLRPPCAGVIDAYLSLLRDKDNFIMPTSFVYHLAKKSTSVMMAWTMVYGDFAKAFNVIIPLSARSNNHWALSVIRRNQQFVDVFDSLPSNKLFIILSPKLVKYANSLRALPNAGEGWSCSYRIREHKEVCSDQDFGADASI